jgi:hypothetical protein
MEAVMRAAQTLLAAVAGAALIGCTSLAPVKVNAGDQCFRCRRTIQDARLAGETIDHNGFVSKFRAPGCMAKYLVNHQEDKSAVYVTDYTTGKMFRPESVWFVPVVVNRDTGERDYRAYRQESDAIAAALDVHAAPMRWSAVIESTN